MNKALSAVVRHLSLLGREAEIVEGFLRGESEKEMSRRLGISIHTVHTYVKRLFRKLSVHSKGAVVGRIVSAQIEFSTEARHLQDQDHDGNDVSPG